MGTGNISSAGLSSLAVQSSHEAQAVSSTSPNLETVKHESEAFKRDANVVLRDVSAGFQKFITEEAKHDSPKLFGSNLLGKAFHAVSNKLESFLALQKGTIGRAFNMEKTPYYQSLKNVAQGMGRVSESVDKLHTALEQVESGEDTSTSPDELRAKLGELKESVETMLDHVDYTAARNDPEREKLLFSVCVFGDSLLEGIEEAQQNLNQLPTAASSAQCLREFGKPEVYQKALDKMNSPERLDFKAWAMEELAGIKKDATQLETDVTTQAAEIKNMDSTESYAANQKEALEFLQERCDEVADKLDNVSLKSLETQGYTDNKVTAEIEETSSSVTHTASMITRLFGRKVKPVRAETLSNKEQTSDAVQQTNKKKIQKFPPISSITTRHHCSTPSPHKPDGVNTSFYHEKQSESLCLKHALNAFVGFEAFSVDDMVEGNIEAANLVVGKGPYKTSPESWLEAHPEYKREDIEARGDEIFHEVSQDFAEMIAGDKLDRAVRRGNEVTVGKAMLDSHQERLGAPNLKYVHVVTPEKAREAIAEAKSVGDRILVGTSGHFFTYRQNKAGDWFKIDSISSRQTKEDPSVIASRMVSRGAILYYENKDPNIKTW